MPGRKYTPAQAARAMARFEKAWPKTVMRGFNNGLKFSLRYAVTKRMTGGGKRAPSLPSKLRIRSGDLRRSVKIVPARRRGSGVFVAGLKAGGGKVRYARIHEKGGIIRARRVRFLRFQTPDGAWHMKVQVRIPARPYLRPSILATKRQIHREIDKALVKTIDRLL